MKKLKIVFQRDDLLRVRFRGSIDPMWELVLSAHHARTRAMPARYLAWRRALVERSPCADPARRTSLARWWDLVPVHGDFPDFLTPIGAAPDIDAGCAHLSTMAEDELRVGLAGAFAERAAPAWVHALATDGRDGRRTLVELTRDAYGLLVAPWLSEMRETVHLDRAERVRQLSDRGVGAVLAGLPGVLGWDRSVLEMSYPQDRVLELRGRGLTLIPSYFCWGSPVTFIDPELPPVLVYSAAGAGVTGATGVVPKAVATLIGRTRARCLQALLRPLTTSALAACTGVTIGTASKHAAALRDAGLVASTRIGGSVEHNLTDLGVRLLGGTVP